MRHELALAREAWSAGNWLGARHCAQKAMVGASGSRDRHLEASASLLLAQVLTLESRFEWAQRFAARAHSLFRDLSDPVESCEALLSLSYAESALGRDEAALGAASNAVSCARHAPHLGAAGLNYVGIVSFWRREYGMARDVLDAACESAPVQSKHRSASFQPLVNAAFTELLRCADLRMQGGGADTSGLMMLVAKARELEKRDSTKSLSHAASYAGLFLLEFESFYLAHLTGNASRADSHYLACLKRSSTLPESSWMQGLVRWAQLERAVMSKHASQVAASSLALASSYQGGEHVHMKDLARRLCAHSTRKRFR